MTKLESREQLPQGKMRKFIRLGSNFVFDEAHLEHGDIARAANLYKGFAGTRPVVDDGGIFELLEDGTIQIYSHISTSAKIEGLDVMGLSQIILGSKKWEDYYQIRKQTAQALADLLKTEVNLNIGNDVGVKFTPRGK